tara:strand:- start:811 stop:1245 length:435 start_codon:yes stop_codon:yes gene_type:complete
MSDLNTKKGKLISYITRSTIEHFRLFLNNKDLVNDKEVCFFCLKPKYRVKRLNHMEFGFVEYFDYDFKFLTQLADSMGHKYSEDEFIPRYIFSCTECKELINDPDRLFYLDKPEKKEEQPVSNVVVWLSLIYLFFLARAMVVHL